MDMKTYSERRWFVTLNFYFIMIFAISNLYVGILLICITADRTINFTKKK